ncbi:hypothetical protein F511_42252 [Dorcoceras hygrometricum]|uniref:Uncharacterized protein n=1 Tax=Dorcoceras hygrometricum TaxID=472368 RepID=A0A2Z6ZZ98_9LAMI|nr:hypothetical protein F511_42252 [Dorcoceras hygrometricum]
MASVWGLPKGLGLISGGSRGPKRARRGIGSCSLVRPRLGPRLVMLGPAGPGGGPVGRAPAVVAGAGRTVARSGCWSWLRVRVPLEDLIYTSCTDPIRQPAAARTPRLHQPSAVNSITCLTPL